MENRSQTLKRSFSLRQAFSITSLIVVAMGTFYATFTLWTVFQAKRTELNLRLEDSLEVSGHRVDSAFSDARFTVSSLILNLPLVLNRSENVFGDWMKRQANEHLPRNSALHDLYFASSKTPSDRMPKNQAMAFAVTRNLDYYATPAFNSPSTFLFSVFREGTYQTNPQEIWYHGALSASGLYRTPFYFDANFFKQVMISITQAFRDPKSNALLGVAGVDLTAQSFARILGEYRIGNSGGVLLTDSLGHPLVPFLGRDEPILGFKFSAELVNRPDFATNLPHAPNLKCDSRTHQVRGADGLTYVYQSRPLHEPDYCVLAYQAKSEAYASLYKTAGLLSILYVLILFIFLFLTRQLGHFVIKNIDTLLANIEANRKSFTEPGTDPKYHPIQPEGPQEIAYISQQLNVLYQRLETTLREVREEKDRAQLATKTKSRFLSVMSHEIRTPLNAMIGLTDVLLLSPLNSEQSRYLQILQRSGQSLLRILNDILDFSRLEAGKLQIEQHDFDLHPFLYDIECLMRFSAEAKGLAFQVIAPAAEFRLHGDSLRIRQALLNFIGNAIKFTSNGTVEVRVTAIQNGDPRSTHFQFEVCDSGIGITSAQQAKIFSDFSQADSTIPRRYGGTGLGLSISRQIIELLGGKVSFHSEIGKGSTFQFTIPIKVVSQKPARPCEFRGSRPDVIRPNASSILNAQSLANANSSARPILIVDDDENNHHLIDAYLKFHPELRAVHSFSGKEALAKIQEENFLFILMDMEMPEMDGLATTEEIRRLERENGTPRRTIIMLSANTFQEAYEKSLIAGADEHVSKPIKLDRFNELLKRWIPTP